MISKKKNYKSNLNFGTGGSRRGGRKRKKKESEAANVSGTTQEEAVPSSPRHSLSEKNTAQNGGMHSRDDRPQLVRKSRRSGHVK